MLETYAESLLGELSKEPRRYSWVVSSKLWKELEATSEQESSTILGVIRDSLRFRLCCDIQSEFPTFSELISAILVNRPPLNAERIYNSIYDTEMERYSLVLPKWYYDLSKKLIPITMTNSFKGYLDTSVALGLEVRHIAVKTSSINRVFTSIMLHNKEVGRY